jgi:hypothetical protein
MPNVKEIFILKPPLKLPLSGGSLVWLSLMSACAHKAYVYSSLSTTLMNRWYTGFSFGENEEERDMRVVQWVVL